MEWHDSSQPSLPTPTTTNTLLGMFLCNRSSYQIGDWDYEKQFHGNPAFDCGRNVLFSHNKVSIESHRDTHTLLPKMQPLSHRQYYSTLRLHLSATRYNQIPLYLLKLENCHDANFVVIIGIAGCCYEHSPRDHFVNAPSQWETTLHCNVVSHWLGAFTKWSLQSNTIWCCMLKC